MASIRFSLGLSLLAAACTIASGCGSDHTSPEANSGWRKIGDLDGVIIFVESDPNLMQSARQYDEAAEIACGSGCAQVAFFQPGDLVPPVGSRSEFFRNGGWKGYDPIALKFGDEFTVWDCEKLNFSDAPQSALCGENSQEAYSSVLSIAVRDGWTVACELKDFDGFAVVKTYAETLKGDSQRKHILDGYRQMYESSRKGPDDPEFCQTGRQMIEEKAEAAKKHLNTFLKT